MVSIAIRQSIWPAWLRRRSTLATPGSPLPFTRACRHWRAAWQRPVARAPVAGPLWPATRRGLCLQPTATPVRLQLATRPLAEAHGEWVRFKTTRRAHYAAFAPAPGSGIFDTVLFNAEGEITESTFGNLAMQMDDGRWLTPPLACGLLPGVGRAVALREGRVQEGVVRVQDLHRVRRWAFINSLRGWLRCAAPANCHIPDDCIDPKRYPLFMARAVLQELIESLQSTRGVKPC
jgi:hypothetical protein